MLDGKSIYQEQDFGTIKLRLKEALKERNYSRSMLAKKTGIRYDIIKRYYEDDLERVDKTILAKICYCLECSLSDLLVYVSPKE